MNDPSKNFPIEHVPSEFTRSDFQRSPKYKYDYECFERFLINKNKGLKDRAAAVQAISFISIDRNDDMEDLIKRLIYRYKKCNNLI